MSTMLLESALAELSSAQPNAGHGGRSHGQPPSREARLYANMHTPVDVERSNAGGFSSAPCSANAVLRETNAQLGMEKTRVVGSSPNVVLQEANARLGFGHRSSSSKQLPPEMDRRPPTCSRSISANPQQVGNPDVYMPPSVDRTRSSEMDRQRSPPLSSSSPDSSSSRASSEASSNVDNGGEPHSTRHVATYEKQISIDPHSVSYRRTSSFTPPAWESDRSTPEVPGMTSALYHSQPPNADRARSSISDGSVAPHSPRSINFPGKMRSYLRGRLSVPDLTQVNSFADTSNSDYSSDLSSSYSLAESPVSTLDLHRSPLNVAPPSPPPDDYYEAIYVPPPAPPPPSYRSLSANAGRGTARTLFSAPLPQPQRLASYKKTLSFQVREVDDFTYGREERYKVTPADIVERRASWRQDSNVERHASLQRDTNFLANRGMSLERRHHSLQEILEDPRSSSADMSCCSFLPFLGCPKARIPKQSPQIKHHISPAPLRRVLSQRSFHDIAIPPSDGFVKQNASSELFSLGVEAEAIFYREPSLMERFEYRNSSSTSEIYAEGEEDDCDEETEADRDLSKIERAEEVLLSFNEAYSPVTSAFVFRPNENTSTISKGGEASVAPRKALKGSNGPEGSRPAFRRVRFNLESTEAAEQEVESVVSSSASNSREMSTLMGNMGPFSLSRSTSRREWDDLLMPENHSNNQYGEFDALVNKGINDGYDNLGVYGNLPGYTRAESMRQHQADPFMTMGNGTISSKRLSSRTPYKPMLFRPDTN